jgi:hypothetical protein
MASNMHMAPGPFQDMDLGAPTPGLSSMAGTIGYESRQIAFAAELG